MMTGLVSTTIKQIYRISPNVSAPYSFPSDAHSVSASVTSLCFLRSNLRSS
nr:MAG TPA: hypothetical protein [Caudoviricetes sp.]